MPKGDFFRQHANPSRICERLNDEIKRIQYHCQTDRQKELTKFLSLAALELAQSFEQAPSDNLSNPTLTASS